MASVYLDETTQNFIYDQINLSGAHWENSGLSQDYRMYLPVLFTGNSANQMVISDGVNTLNVTGSTTWSDVISWLNTNNVSPGAFNITWTGPKQCKLAVFACITKNGSTYNVAFSFYGRRSLYTDPDVQRITAAIGLYGSRLGATTQQWFSSYDYGEYVYRWGIVVKAFTNYQDAYEYLDSFNLAFPMWKDFSETAGTNNQFIDHYNNSSEARLMDAWLLSDEGWNMTDEWTKPRSILDSINAYIMTDLRLERLRKGLWITDALNNGKFSNSLYANPMECILGLNFIPFDPSGNIGSLEDVVVGLQHIHYTGDPGVNLDATKLTNEYKEFDFGTKTLVRPFGDYRDFTEVQCEIYLPCIGWHTLNSEEVMGKNLTVKYRVNFVTGDIVAILSINGTIIDSVPGNCLQSIPYSGRDMTSLIGARTAANGNLMSIGAGIVSAAVGVGTAAAGNPMGLAAIGGGIGAIANGINQNRNAANEISKAQNQVQKSGSIGGSTGIMGYTTPYIVMRSHTDAMPTGWETYIGESSHKIVQVGTLTGYVQTKNFRFASTTATQEEIDEINALMDGGVII